MNNNVEWYSNFKFKVSDNSGVIRQVYQTFGPNINSTLREGTYTISYEASDSSGYSGTCSFNVTIAGKDECL